MKPQRILLGTLLCATAACSGGGGSSSSRSTIAPSTSGTAPTSSSAAGSITSSATPGVASFDGTWEVSGNDPARGAYGGTATVAASASGGYAIERLVTFQTKLPDGRELASAWNATGKDESGGLRLDASLVRAHVFRRAGAVTRTAADQQPLAVTGLFTKPGGGPVGLVSVGTKMTVTLSNGLTETWTRSNATAPAFPVKSVQLVPGHNPPSATVKKSMFFTFASYHALKQVAPFVGRPEFGAAIHEVIVDRTALDFYQKRGPNVVLVLDKVVDEVSIAEETRRANAFSRRLAEKAKLFDDELTKLCSDPNGMVTALDRSVTPAKRSFAQSPVLYTGVWTLSQLFRYRVTGEQEAFDNVVRGATGACLCVEVPPVKTEFARAVDFVANATPGQITASGGKYSWEAGTGPYAHLMWMRGGNNDMLHGIEACLVAAAAILPANHPLRARVGAAAASLLDNVSEAQNGLHEIHLAGVAAKITGDPKYVDRYKKALGLRNIKDQIYIAAGGNLIQEQGIADWSGHHLGTFSYLLIRELGGSSPKGDELTWRTTGEKGIAAGFGMTGVYRNGLVAAVAAGAKAPGASDLVKGILTEFPYPKTTGDCVPDFTVSSDFCLSPYPSLPWKLDWVTNTNERTQSLRSYPLFYRGGDINYWSRSPLTMGSGADSTLAPGQDYLVAYWFSRLVGAIGPLD